MKIELIGAHGTYILNFGATLKNDVYIYSQLWRPSPLNKVIF